MRAAPLLCFLAALLLFGYRGVIDCEDGLIRWQGALRLAAGDGLTHTVYGGVLPVKYGPAHSLLALPLLLAGMAAGPLLSATSLSVPPHLLLQAAFMAIMPLATLATVLLLLRWAHDLQVHPHAAAGAALAYACGSFALVAANLAFDEPLHGLFLLAAVHAAWRGAGIRAALWWAGALCTRATALLALPALLLLPLPRRRFAAAVALVLAVFGAYQYLHGTATPDAGYRGEGFTTPLTAGLHGLLATPGKSVFLFAPPLLLLPWAAARAWSRRRRLLLAIGWLATAYLVTYAKWVHWPGDTFWGPRYLLPVLPAVTVLFLLLPRAGLRALLVLTLCGFLVNLPGFLLSYQAGWTVTLQAAHGDRAAAYRLWRHDPYWSAPRVTTRLLQQYPPDTLLLSAHWPALAPLLRLLRPLAALALLGTALRLAVVLRP